MTDAHDMAIRGVTLAQFAFVRAGLADGLETGELLGFLGLDVDVWAGAEKAWDDRVLDALEEDPAFFDALDDATAKARESWKRRVRPLDEDLRAWFDFLHAWMADADPSAFLKRMGVGPAELAHVHRRWSARLAEDAALHAEALAILASDRAEPPVPKLERPRFVRRRAPVREGDSVTAEIAHAKGETLPFGEGEPGPLPPPLAVPLPRRPRARATVPGADVTHPGTSAAAEALPFVDPAEVQPFVRFEVGRIEPAVEPAKPALVVAPSIEEADTDLDRTVAIDMTSGASIALASAFVPVRVDTTKPMLAIEEHAALVAELTAGGELTALLARYGLTPEAKETEDAHWARELQRDPKAQEAWMRAFEEARATLAAREVES